MSRKLFKIAAWASLAFIVYATLVPLAMRPTAGSLGPNFERFAAYALAACLLVVAYPGHSLRIGFSVALIAVVLELAQLVIPDRDARVVDTLIKIAGALSGTLAASIFNRWVVGRVGAKSRVLSD